VMIDFNNIPKKYYDMIIENYIKLFWKYLKNNLLFYK
jgi:hypothetical protein